MLDKCIKPFCLAAPMIINFVGLIRYPVSVKYDERSLELGITVLLDMGILKLITPSYMKTKYKYFKRYFPVRTKN